MKQQKGFISIPLVIGIIALLGITGYLVARTKFFPPTPPAAEETRIGGEEGSIYCTQDAKLCPDGSYVSRIPPACEFAACPSGDTSQDGTGGKLKSGISGTVLLGPQCPVVGPGLEEQCADKPLQTTLAIMKTDRKTEVARFTSNTAGKFSVAVPAGDYIVVSLPEKPLPRCSESVKVETGKFAEIVVHCDSGIR